MVDGRRTFAVKALGALLAGAVLGVLMGAPHEEMLGLSIPFYSALQSLVSTATFVGLTTGWPIKLTVDR